MAAATITSKGQVTIPQEIRERLGLHAGDRIDFRIDPDGSLRVVPETKRVDEVFGMLASRVKKRGFSIEEMDAGVAASMRRRAGA